MKNLIQNNFFATCVIEFLQSNDTIEDLEYEDLLNYMNQIEPPDGIDIGVDDWVESVVVALHNISCMFIQYINANDYTIRRLNLIHVIE